MLHSIHFVRSSICFHIQNIHHFFIVDDETFKQMSLDLLMLHSIYFDHHFVFTFKTFITPSSWMTKRLKKCHVTYWCYTRYNFDHHFVFTFKTFITSSSWMTKRLTKCHVTCWCYTRYNFDHHFVFTFKTFIVDGQTFNNFLRTKVNFLP